MFAQVDVVININNVPLRAVQRERKMLVLAILKFLQIFAVTLANDLACLRVFFVFVVKFISFMFKLCENDGGFHDGETN